LIDIVQ